MGEMGDPLGAEVDEPLVDSVIDELTEPIVEVEAQMVALVMDMEEDLAMLFRVKDDSCDDDFQGPKGDKEGHSLTFLAHEVSMPPSMIEDLCTRIGFPLPKGLTSSDPPSQTLDSMSASSAGKSCCNYENSSS
nr:hypothetical protein [Tanacetum cinerariifolium]